MPARDLLKFDHETRICNDKSCICNDKSCICNDKSCICNDKSCICNDKFHSHGCRCSDKAIYGCSINAGRCCQEALRKKVASESDEEWNGVEGGWKTSVGN